MFTSKETRKAWSFFRSTSSRNWLPACFSSGRTYCWLPEVSSRIPRVRGKSVSAWKFLRVCGTLSSATLQSFLVRWGTRIPLLSFTVKKRSTRFTWSLKVATDCCWSSWVAGAVLTGGASGDGANCAQSDSDNIGAASRTAAALQEKRILVNRRSPPHEESITQDIEGTAGQPEARSRV